MTLLAKLSELHFDYDDANKLYQARKNVIKHFLKENDLGSLEITDSFREINPEEYTCGIQINHCFKSLDFEDLLTENEIDFSVSEDCLGVKYYIPLHYGMLEY